jgi:hypothetical protein
VEARSEPEFAELGVLYVEVWRYQRGNVVERSDEQPTEANLSVDEKAL